MIETAAESVIGPTWPISTITAGRLALRKPQEKGKSRIKGSRRIPNVRLGLEIRVFKRRASVPGIKREERCGGMATWDDETSAGLAPRLRIAHLLCWTAASALGFAAYRGITPSLGPGSPRVYLGVYDSVMGLALGTILTGVGIMAYRRWRRGMPYPSLPGHWLLILGLAAAVADGVAIGVFEFLTRLYYPPLKWPPGTVNLPKVLLIQFLISKNPDVIGVYHQAFGWGIGAVSALALSWHLRRRLSWPWLAVFLVFALAAAILSAGHVRSLIRVQYSSTLWPISYWCLQSAHVYARFILAGTIVMLAALVWDVRSRARVDGLHWAGAATWLVTAAFQYATYLLIL